MLLCDLRFVLVVGVVILNYNTLAETKKCVGELLSTDAPGRSILVLDNGSSSNEALSLRGEFGDRVIIARSPTNLGFAGGCNFAADILLRRLTAKAILFLNSDARITWQEIAKLERFMESNPDIAAVGPNIMFPDGTPQSAGGTVDFMRGEPLWFAEPVSSVPYEVQVVHGAAILIRKGAWDSVGPFDREYFAYSEETDWCVRAAAQGWKLFCVPQCQAFHGLRGTSKGRVTPMHIYLWARNRMMFVRKRGTPRHIPLFLLYMLWYSGRRFLQHRIRGERENSIALLKGVRDGLGWWLLTSTLPEDQRGLSEIEASSIEELT